MTTKEAFKHLSDQRGWYKQTGINDSTARSLKSLFNDDKLSTDRMMDLLRSAGYSEIPAQWKPADKLK